jgi:hypothetical protein
MIARDGEYLANEREDPGADGDADTVEDQPRQAQNPPQLCG